MRQITLWKHRREEFCNHVGGYGGSQQEWLDFHTYHSVVHRNRWKWGNLQERKKRKNVKAVRGPALKTIQRQDCWTSCHGPDSVMIASWLCCHGRRAIPVTAYACSLYNFTTQSNNWKKFVKIVSVILAVLAHIGSTAKVEIIQCTQHK